MYDYDFVLKSPGEGTNNITYQKLVAALSLEKEIVHGAPMSEGGTPQAFWLKQVIETASPSIKVSIYFNGNQLA